MKLRTVMTAMLLLACAPLFAGGSAEPPPAPVTRADGYRQIEAGGNRFAWKVADGRLFVEFSAPTTGWIAVGFNPTSAMKDANIILGWVKGSEVVVRDEFGHDLFGHKEDSALGGTADVADSGGSEAGGVTTLRFSIPLASADKFDGTLAAGAPTRVIWAYGPNGADDARTMHAKRGKFTISL